MLCHQPYIFQKLRDLKVKWKGERVDLIQQLRTKQCKEDDSWKQARVLAGAVTMKLSAQLDKCQNPKCPSLGRYHGLYSGCHGVPSDGTSSGQERCLRQNRGRVT